jgi:hypothetical protein
MALDAERELTQSTAGIYVKLPFAIATVDVAIGGKGNIRAGNAFTCPAFNPQASQPCAGPRFACPKIRDSAD